MGTNRETDSVKPTIQGQKKLIDAQRRKLNYEGVAYSYLEITTEAASFKSEKTVSRFFNGEAIKYKNALAICQVLDLDIEDVIEQVEKRSIRKYDWSKICTDMFADQQTKFRTRRGLLNPDRELSVYVPLGLVKPKPRQSKSLDQISDSSLGMRQYEVAEDQIEKTFEHDAFLSEIVEQSSKSVVIVGEPGAGKSTWMEKIGDYFIKISDLPLPIFIPLSLLDRKLEDYLCEVWLDEALQLQNLSISDEIVKEFKELLRTKHFCLLLDGLDEMKSEHPTRDLSDNLQGVLKNIRVFLSCRLNVWEVAGRIFFPTPKFDVFRSLAFSDGQVEKFIQQWHINNFNQGQKLIQQLKEDRVSRLRDLVKNPLRLVMLCNIWEKNQELPQTKADLYLRFVALTYYRERTKLTILEQDIENLNQALGELAKRMIDEEKQLDSSFVSKILGNQFELAKKVGWLNQVGINADKAIYAFSHLTFAEYFAACAIDDWDFFLPRDHTNYPVQDKKYRIFDKQWEEVYLFWIGNKKNKNDYIFLLNALINFQENNDFYRYKAQLKACLSIPEIPERHIQENVLDIMLQWSFWGFFDLQNKSLKECQWVIHERVIDQLNSIRDIWILEKIILRIKEFMGKINDLVIVKIVSNIIEIIPWNIDAVNILFDFLENHSVLIQYQSRIALEKIIDYDISYINQLINIFESSDNEETKNHLYNILNFSKKYDWSHPNLCKFKEKKECELKRLQKQRDNSKNNFDSTNLFSEEDLLIFQQIEVSNEEQLVNFISSAFSEEILDCIFDKLIEMHESNQIMQSQFSIVLERILQKARLNQLLLLQLTIFIDKILKTKQDFLSFISISKKILDAISKEEMKSEWDSHFCCKIYGLLFDYTDNLTYSEFHTVWHNVKPKNQIVLHYLSDHLRSQGTIDTNIYYLDSSKISDQRKPALDYYDQLEAQGYPKVENEPDTLQKLKRHWNKTQRQQLQKDLLILDSSKKTSNNDALDPEHFRIFGQFEGYVAAITTTSSEYVQTFDPHDPHLLDNLQKWINRIQAEQ